MVEKIGKIYPGGGPFDASAGKVIFDDKNFGVVKVKTEIPVTQEMKELIDIIKAVKGIERKLQERIKKVSEKK